MIFYLRKYILLVALLVIILPIVGVGLLFMGLWLWTIVVWVLAFILNKQSATFSLFGSKISNQETHSLRILTFNLNRAHEFSVNHGSEDEVVKFVVSQKADIILFQEYNESIYPNINNHLSAIYPYKVEKEKTSRYKSIYSRYPIEDFEQLYITSGDEYYNFLQHTWYSGHKEGDREVLPVCSMVIKVGYHRIRLLNCHLMSNNYSVVIRDAREKGRSLLWAILPILKRLDYGYAFRKQQSDIVCRYLSSCKENEIIVCGDFNDISGSSTLMPFYKIGLNDAWWDRGFGFGFTYHGLGLRLRIDHILYSKCLYLLNIYVPYSDISDHSPIVADFKI